MRSRFRYGRWLIVLFLAVACLSPTAALASNKGAEVPCRVESNVVKVRILDGNVTYGTVELGTSQDTVALGETQTVTNKSNKETVDFTITSSNALGVIDWTLGVTAGADTFTHTACIDGTSWDIAMTVAGYYYPLASSVVVDGVVNVDLKIGMPTSATDIGAHTITVTILAVESGG